MINDLKHSISLDIYNNGDDREATRFIRILLDVRNINLSQKERSELIDLMYTESNMIKKAKVFTKNFNNLINTLIPQINDNLLFITDLDKSEYNLILSNDYNNVVLGEYLYGFLNLDFNKFIDFFKFFCTFVFMYKDKLEKKYYDMIFNSKVVHEIKLNDDNIEPIDKQQLLKCAEKLYKDEKDSLIHMQKLFKDFIDYIFNNNRDSKLSSLSNNQRFYIFENINQEIQDLSKQYTCAYNLGFRVDNSKFVDELLYGVIRGNPNPLKDENFLINNFLENDPIGLDTIPSSYTFYTDNLYTYFYIVLYHIVKNKNEYIKKCQVCGKYFFSNKDTALYCNGKYNSKMTCKEYGIKTSQKRKEQDEPVYKKYRQIYAKKAMMVKRNPDIPSYKTNYEIWKKEAKEFITEIKNSKKTYDEFDKWLNKKQ